jgi:hypothetical protein
MEYDYRESALPWLVSIISGMSRSAESSAELFDTSSKIKQLIRVHAQRTDCDPRKEVILRTHLAFLLLRLQMPGEARLHVDQAREKIMQCWLSGCAPVLGDWRVAAHLFYQCTLYGSTNEELPKEFERQYSSWLELKGQQDESLQQLFSWCASRLILADLRRLLAGALCAASSQMWSSQTITRALSAVLFDYFWRLFSCDRRKLQVLGADMVCRIEKICQTMLISCTDLFSTMALCLMSLAPLLQGRFARVRVQSITTIRLSDTAALEALQRVHKAALALLTDEKRVDFIQAFLFAHATINLIRVDAVCADFISLYAGKCDELDSSR